MMQIVLNTLQTDSGDQPGSDCLSQKQKIKSDVRSWAQWPASQLWTAAGSGLRVPGGTGDLYRLLCGLRKHSELLAFSILNASIHHPPSPWPVLTLTSPCCSQALTGISLCVCIPAQCAFTRGL